MSQLCCIGQALGECAMSSGLWNKTNKFPYSREPWDRRIHPRQHDRGVYGHAAIVLHFCTYDFRCDEDVSRSTAKPSGEVWFWVLSRSFQIFERSVANKEAYQRVHFQREVTQNKLSVEQLATQYYIEEDTVDCKLIWQCFGSCVTDSKGCLIK